MNTPRNIIIFIGPPGSGKGSLSNLCIESLKWVQLSTGNLCRKHIAEQTPIGREMDETIRAGKLISDQLIIDMVDEWLLEQRNGQLSIILDGYPRTITQAKALHSLVADKLNAFSIKIVKLSIEDEQIIARLCSRSICQNKNCQAVYSTLVGSALAPEKESECNKCSSPLIRRPDDEIEAIKERLKTYYKHEKDLLGFYEKSGLEIKKVNVDKPLHDVFKEFKQLIGVHHDHH